MKAKILLCGTNYGASYLPAIAAEASPFELGGIFARGSDRSRDLAKQKGVPFWSTTAEVADDVRAAVIALPPPASETVAKELIARGIHLLVEHPISREHLHELRELALRRSVVVHVNCHFAELTAPRMFTTECLRRGRPQYASIVIAPRSAYATFDLVGRAFCGLANSFLEREDAPANVEYPFASFRGKLGNVSVRVQCSKSLGHVDDGSDSPVPQRIEVGFGEGNLLLASPVGPVIWTEKLRLALRDHPGPLFTTLTESAPTFAELVKDRLAANGRALDDLARCIDGAPEPVHQKTAWLSTVADLTKTVRSIQVKDDR